VLEDDCPLIKPFGLAVIIYSLFRASSMLALVRRVVTAAIDVPSVRAGRARCSIPPYPKLGKNLNSGKKPDKEDSKPEIGNRNSKKRAKYAGLARNVFL